MEGEWKSGKDLFPLILSVLKNFDLTCYILISVNAMPGGGGVV